jgi:hypothetical protein
MNLLNPCLWEKVRLQCHLGKSNFQPDLSPGYPSWDLACTYNQAHPLWTVEGTFQTCLHRIHAFLAVLRHRDWPVWRHVDDGFRGLVTFMDQIDAVVKGKKSQLMAAIMNFTLLRFLTSQRVPGRSPLRFTDILTSHRREPYPEKIWISFSKKGWCNLPPPCFHHLTPAHVAEIGGTVRMLQLLPENCNHRYFRIEKDK